MEYILQKHSEEAKILANESIEERVKNILFKIICEDWGYSYTQKELLAEYLIGRDNSEIVDYIIPENIDMNIFKLAILVVWDGQIFEDKRDSLKYFMSAYPGIKNALITDGIIYEFYSPVIENGNIKGITCVKNIDIRNPEDSDEEFIASFSKKHNTQPERQRFVGKVSSGTSATQNTSPEDDVIDFDDEDLEIEERVKKSPPKKQPEKKQDNKEKEKKKGNKAITIIIIFMIIATLLAAYLFLFPKQTQETSQPETIDTSDNSSPEYIDWSKIEDGTNSENSTTSMQYIDIKSVIATNRLAGNDLEISLLNTNIEDGTIIKFSILCNTNVGTAYATIKNGECKTTFDIPETWDRPEITIIAYIRFDETGDYEQPKNVKELYGNDGEYIKYPSEAPKYAISYTYTTHENQAVIDYINANMKDAQNAAIATREKDLAQIETLYDAKGNIKHVPGGLSVTKGNITETRHVYPMIFYDAEKGKSYFYIIAGYVGKDWLSFETVAFYCDTYSWGYKVGTNPKEHQLSGEACSEWVYYSDEYVLTLLNDMNLLANSNDTVIQLTGGPISRKYEITKEEKDNIKFMLYIYQTYYGNGTKVPDIEWFKAKEESMDLSYIKTPEEIKMRNSTEINQMDSLQKTITTARQNGETVSAEEQALYEQMLKTYKVIEESDFSKLLNEIKNSEEAYAVYDVDKVSTGLEYMRFYLEYSNANGTTETGYIPYIDVFSDKTVQFPFVTVTGNMKETQKTLVELPISSELYSELVSISNNTNYEYLSGQ